jgi:hypothetical protein
MAGLHTIHLEQSVNVAYGDETESRRRSEGRTVAPCRGFIVAFGSDLSS